MNDTEMETMMSIVDAFSAAMTQANVTFFLYSGSLLGSWRHHGLVPWDDDVDVILPAVLRPVVQKALRKLEPQYGLRTFGVRWKMYAESSPKPHSDIQWRWPYLDICFYLENSSHIWDLDERYYPGFWYNKNDVFPLTQRPFQGRLLSTPRNSFAVLNKTHHIDECGLHWFSHRFEKALTRADVATVKCEKLKHLFPFVLRTTRPGSAGGCSEALVKNGTLVNCCFVDHGLKDCSNLKK
ncbi:uncharacterized protein RP688-like [Babylonia areolata]|uniref:uncharacterized protein RP688-like n=1 Tax=Babylonia areolata TaxID=304850 RepID=UPI003FD53650